MEQAVQDTIEQAIQALRRAQGKQEKPRQLAFRVKAVVGVFVAVAMFFAGQWSVGVKTVTVSVPVPVLMHDSHPTYVMASPRVVTKVVYVPVQPKQAKLVPARPLTASSNYMSPEGYRRWVAKVSEHGVR